MTGPQSVWTSPVWAAAVCPGHHDRQAGDNLDYFLFPEARWGLVLRVFHRQRFSRVLSSPDFALSGRVSTVLPRVSAARRGIGEAAPSAWLEWRLPARWPPESPGSPHLFSARPRGTCVPSVPSVTQGGRHPDSSTFSTHSAPLLTRQSQARTRRDIFQRQARSPNQREQQPRETPGKLLSHLLHGVPLRRAEATPNTAVT